MKKQDYDFAGWVTKNDTLCSDGVVIKHDAFKDNDKSKVPLVWQHDHNSPENVLGHVILHNRPEGVYGHGYFNDSEAARHAKQSVEHGDISAMSIAANKIKKMGQNVIHGLIFEVSLVLAGANPGALIEHVMRHDAISEDEAIIYTGNLIHAASDVLPEDKKGGSEVNEEEVETTETTEKTIGDVLDTLSEEQMNAVEALVAGIASQQEDEDGEETPPADDAGQIEQSENGGEEMKHNVFEGKDETLVHADRNAVLTGIAAGAKSQSGTLKQVILEHGITNIEMLFPEANNIDKTPRIWGPHNTAADKIISGVQKSPFSKVKTMFADLTEDEARARGYIKGDQKLDQVYEFFTRESAPQTIYKRQSLDRDDVIDITDFDIISFTQAELRMMLNEELARAILVGDGRAVSDKSKIKEDKIRPIIADDDFYTIKKTSPDVATFLETVVKAKGEYRGSGMPTMFIEPTLLADVKLLKGTDGRFLFGDIPTDSEMASRFGVREIVETTFFKKPQALIVNLSDYTVGASKGGEVTTFDDFDIDFNKYKYLIETRVSGALTVPKSAILIDIAGATTTSTTTRPTTTTTTTQP